MHTGHGPAKHPSMAEIVNKIASSGLVTLDLAEYLPAEEEMLVFDLAPFLFRGLVLREKDFREALRSHDWSPYAGRIVTITCSADAIIPLWAYMLVVTYLAEAREVFFGDREAGLRQAVLSRLKALDAEQFRDRRVVLKGCGERPVPADAYVALMHLLMPVARSVMFGEPCSTVPVYKRKGAASADAV